MTIAGIYAACSDLQSDILDTNMRAPAQTALKLNTYITTSFHGCVNCSVSVPQRAEILYKDKFMMETK